MLWWEVLIIILIISYTVFIFFNAIYKKKKAKKACKSGCSSCPYVHKCQESTLNISEELAKIKN